MKTLLVIDDQEEILHLLAYTLQAEGYAVATAKTGQDGLKLARELRPDLIACDIMMPGLSGYDVLRAVRRDLDLAATPFIFLTAKAGHDNLRTGMGLGADDYLMKPFAPEELIKAIEAQLEKYAILRERHDQKLGLLRQGLSTILPHELRTPLSLIITESSLLLEAYDAFDRAGRLEMIDSIYQSSLRLHRLLENLLIYVELEGDATLRLEHPHTPSAERTIVEATIRQAEARHRKHDVKLRTVDGVLAMHPFHLRKIVEELVDNALKFSEPGQPVFVTASQDERTLHLKVEDRGRGMTKAQIENIDAYVQFDRERFEQQGSGLGLTIAHLITELYDGTLEIRSERASGMTVRIHIPDVFLVH